ALEVLAARLALHAAGGAREEAQVVGHERDLVVLEGLQRLAGVARLEVGELVGVLLDDVGELQQGGLAFGGRRPRPGAERLAGGGDDVRAALPNDDLTGAQVLVVTPAHVESAIAFWIGGADEGAVQAASEAEQTAAALGDAGARARPTVGDDDPLLALHDA